MLVLTALSCCILSIVFLESLRPCGNASVPTTSDPCTGNPGLCDPGDPCLNPFAGSCSNPFGGSGPIGWGNGNVGGPDETGGGGDPCAYLNSSGTGVESVDNNSSPSECSATNGVWVPDGGAIYVPPDGSDPTIYGPGTGGPGGVMCIPNATCGITVLAFEIANWGNCVGSNAPGNMAIGAGSGRNSKGCDNGSGRDPRRRTVVRRLGFDCCSS
jgi:hypothetical protein